MGTNEERMHHQGIDYVFYRLVYGIPIDYSMVQTGQIVDSSRVTAILQSIEERLEETTDRRAKLSLVSILTGHFTEREVSCWTIFLDL